MGIQAYVLGVQSCTHCFLTCAAPRRGTARQTMSQHRSLQQHDLLQLSVRGVNSHLKRSIDALAWFWLSAIERMAGKTHGVGKRWKTTYILCQNAIKKTKALMHNQRQRISTLIWHVEETESIFHTYTCKILVSSRKLQFLFVQFKSQSLRKGFQSEK